MRTTHEFIAYLEGRAAHAELKGCNWVMLSIDECERAWLIKLALEAYRPEERHRHNI